MGGIFSFQLSEIQVVHNDEQQKLPFTATLAYEGQIVTTTATAWPFRDAVRLPLATGPVTLRMFAFTTDLFDNPGITDDITRFINTQFTVTVLAASPTAISPIVSPTSSLITSNPSLSPTFTSSTTHISSTAGATSTAGLSSQSNSPEYRPSYTAGPSQTLPPVSLSSSPSESHSLSKASTAGVSAGVFVLGMLCGIGIYLVLKRRRFKGTRSLFPSHPNSRGGRVLVQSECSSRPISFNSDLPPSYRSEY